MMDLDDVSLSNRCLATTITPTPRQSTTTQTYFVEVITTVVIVVRKLILSISQAKYKQKNNMVQAKLMFTMATLALANAFSPSSQGPQTVRGMTGTLCCLFACPVLSSQEVMPKTIIVLPYGEIVVWVSVVFIFILLFILLTDTNFCFSLIVCNLIIYNIIINTINRNRQLLLVVTF